MLGKGAALLANGEGEANGSQGGVDALGGTDNQVNVTASTLIGTGSTSHSTPLPSSSIGRLPYASKSQPVTVTNTRRGTGAGAATGNNHNNGGGGKDCIVA